MKKIQIVSIVAIVVIMGYLYNKPVKGLEKAKEATPAKGAAMAAADDHDHAAATVLTLEQISETAKTIIGPNLAVKINELEGKLSAATGDAAKLEVDEQLAAQWDDVNQPGPAAFYYKAIAQQKSTADSWITAGDRFNNAYKLTQDTLAQPTYLNNAVEAFETARKLAPDNIDAKVGLGVAYVNGGAPSPMQGISLLLEAVKQEPKNLNANLNLGIFSMKSGQFDKAVERFKTVVAQKPEVEPYFYLAESYKQLGKKQEAIAAYKKCKEMMPDPAFGERIDAYIKELN